MWGRAGAHSGSASVVSAFSSPLLAPGFAWRPSFRGRRCYTHLPPGVLALGVLHRGSCVFLFGDHYDFTSTGRLSYRQCAQYCVRHAWARREAGDCRGVRAASLGVCVHRTWCCMLCVQAGWQCVLCAVCRQTGQRTERMAERARSVPRARLVQCRICVVSGARRQGRSAEHAG